ncbi:hypothetical protein [Pectinatus cerevisiiphilus]|uniref:Uncharacterized protein n=1 Tax=Pectinatus cerevisiiphilus TaxID=86956 RepID=A0A4R3KDQ3_9FIRM|nr:hypothetical protein [Pectinatus cerevisiiphilus]TCS81414.1 hypothetical protein EDC37_102115 [Pectinatus cerevisiiphilus]
MKKVMFVLLGLCIISLSQIAFANPYPKYLNGDTNFVMCLGHNGTGWYVDKSSLEVEKYAPPQYIIAVNVVRVDNVDKGNIDISDIQTLRFFYNYNLRRMYVDQDGNSDWSYINPDKGIGATAVDEAGEMAFELAYKIKFYNKSIYE